MKEREQVRNRVFGTLLMNAILRWETAVTLLVTMILFLFVNDINILGIQWQPWFWLVLGGLAEAALVISAVTDPEESAQAIAREFEAQYDISRIRNTVSRQRLNDALEYRRNMLKLVDRHQGSMRLSLRQTVDDVNDWIGHMYDLAGHIDSFESTDNDIVMRDLKAVPQKIDKVKQRIKLENDARVKSDLEDQLKQLEIQQRQLEETQNNVKRAGIQLESTLASLGTVYAQMSLLGTKEVDSARAQRLRLEIKDEVAGLQDTIEAMTDVQSSTLRMSS
jgi:hypothetical protein